MDNKVGYSNVSFITLSLAELKSYAMPRAKDQAERDKIGAAIKEREDKGVHPHATGSQLERELNR